MLAPLALALVGTVALSGLAYRSVDVLIGTSDRVEHTQAVLIALDDVAAHLKDAHRGERGYIITGEDRFLAPFESARAQIAPSLGRVARLVEDNRAQQARADTLAGQAYLALQEMIRAVELRREIGFEAAREEVESGHINALIDAASETIRAMEDEERTLLVERTERAAASAERTRTMVLLGALVAGLLTMLIAFVLIRDLRAQRALGDALAASREHFRALVETAGSAIVGVDADHCIVEFNAEAERLAGRRRADVLGRPLAELFAEQPGFEAFERLVARALSGEPVREFDAPFLAADGTGHILLWNLARWEDGAGRPLGAIAVGRDITLRKRMEEALRHEATHDALTGLLNRRAFEAALAVALRRGRGGVLFLDLDRFKQVNDTLGHAAGDALLRLAADRLRDALADGDTLARLGGDEFALLLPEATSSHSMRLIADRLRAALAAPYEVAGTRVSAPASLGGVVLDPALTPGEVLRRADVAMYAAKAAAGQPRLYDPALDTCTLDTLAGPVEIERGIERGEFAVFYQPIVRLADGALAGFEALLRWEHPTRGLLPPSEFIPLAEDTGLIGPLGDYALEAALEQLATWQNETPELLLMMSVNVSRAQFIRPDAPQRVVAALRRAGVARDRLLLEVTERVLERESAAVGAAAPAFADSGLHLCLDDFGTGYSALAALLDLPIRTIKVDRQFVARMDEPEAFALLEGVRDLADRLGRDLVAEGIETAEQREALRAMGYAFGQGYLFSRPVPAEAATRIVCGERAWVDGTHRTASDRTISS